MSVILAVQPIAGGFDPIRRNMRGDSVDICYAVAMNVEPRHPLLPPEGVDYDEWLAAKDAEADADIAAGRGVDHATVSEWLRKWGTEEEEPAPREWFE